MHRLPRLQTPTLELILADLGNPSALAVGLALGVSSRTVQRWRVAGHAPRAPKLDLYWLTSWGRAELDASLHLSESAHRQLSDARGREIDALRRELARVLSLGNFGSANAPSWSETAADVMELRKASISSRG